MPTAEEVRLGLSGNGTGRGKRGTVNNAGRLQAFSESRGKGDFDWGGCDPRWIADIVVAITSLGGALTIGRSRDGGAGSITLLLDGDRQTLWFNGDADLDAELEKVRAVLETMR